MNVINHIFVVQQNHPRASDANDASEAAPLRTIQAAANRAQPGDTILVRAGIYREEIVPPRGGAQGAPIIYQAAPGELVTVRGSDVYEGAWQAQAAPGVYAAKVTPGPNDYNPFAIPLVEKLPSYIEKLPQAVTHRTLGQVYINGTMLAEVDRREHLEQMPGTWLAEAGGTVVLVHFPDWVVRPEDCLVELSMRKAIFRPARRGLGYLTLQGFILEHAANAALTSFWENGFPPQQGLVSCRSGHHWRIVNNTIRFAKSIGLDVGSEGRMETLDGQPTPGLVGYHEIVGNTISDNGQGGICGLGHIGTQIRNNVFERNNNLGAMAWEEAAIKTHFYINGVIEGNLIRSNYCNGIWLDNVYQNIRVSRNVILNNQGAGVFIEMGGGPCLIDNNFIALQSRGNGDIGGHGIYGHDAGGITIAHNWLAQNASFGVSLQIAVDRNYAIYPEGITSFDQPAIGEAPCHCRNNRIENNVFVDNQRGAVDLPYPAAKAGENTCDHNMFAGPANFSVNTTAGATETDVLAALRLASAQIDERGPNVGNFLVYDQHILIPMTTWQELMGMDRASQLAKIDNLHWQMVHPGPGPWLAFRMEQLTNMICNTSPGVDTDFYGQTIPVDRSMPGPFQTIESSGSYHYRLWP